MTHKYFLSLFLIIFSLISLSQSTAQDRPFITIWQTDNEGGSDDNQIEIPASGTYTIEWEEVGNPNNKGTAEATGVHVLTFPTASKYRVKLNGDLAFINFGNNPDAVFTDRGKIVDIEQWGDIQWTTMSNAFAGCQNLVCSAQDAPNLSQVSSTSGMFNLCSAITGDFSNWDVSNVKDMRSMFRGTDSFNSNINAWDVSQVEYMSSMFEFAIVFNQPLDNWNVSKVKDMSFMFSSAYNFNQSLKSWNMQNVKSLLGTFQLANDFNQEFGNGEFDSLKIVRGCFANAVSFNQDLSHWNVSGVTNFSLMFWGAKSFNGDISKWNLQSAKDLSGLFQDANSFNRDISAWNVSNVINMSGMFGGATSFNQELSDWDVSNVKSISYMFWLANSFNQDLSTWNVSNVEQMTSMFEGAISFDQDLSTWKVSKVKSMNAMFKNATNFKGDLSRWDYSGIRIPGLENFLDGTKLSMIHYNNLLDAWAKNDSIAKKLKVGVAGLELCGGFDSRDKLISDFNWQFVGDTVNCGLELLSLSPANESVGHANNEPIYLIFADSIQPYRASIQLDDVILTNLNTNDAVVLEDIYTSYDTLFIQPKENLEPYGSYKAYLYILTVKAETGQYNAETEWTFTTGCAPYCLSITGTYPEQNASEVNLDTEIRVAFDSEVSYEDLSAIQLINQSNSEVVTLQERFFMNDSLHIVPAQLLERNVTYEVSIPANVFTNNLDVLNEPIIWSFSTGTKILANNKPSVFKQLKIFPNPFSEFTTIQFESSISQTVSLLIYDVKGSIVGARQNLLLQVGENTIEVKRNDLPKGLYNFQIISDQGIAQGKFVVE